jgi:hypothetical protein
MDTAIANKMFTRYSTVYLERYSVELGSLVLWRKSRPHTVVFTGIKEPPNLRHLVDSSLQVAR